MIRKFGKTLVGDFETTVYDGQESTEVWASALVELYTDDVHIFHGISETFDYLKSLKCNVRVYYHNLKFDGSFWLDLLLRKLKYRQAIYNNQWKTEKYMCAKEFKYTISNRGQWYTIKIKMGKYFLEIRDSLKLLPFSVETIGKSFGTKHKKLSMNYVGFRYSGCEITPKEKVYISNDVLVVKEALEIMFNDGHDSLTIGACCLKEFKKIYGREDYNTLFPSLTDVSLSEEKYSYKNADAYIRKSYKGGWCYLVKGKDNKVHYNGTTADVNSLYPSMMHSDSGNFFPIGVPRFWQGNIPNFAIGDKKYFFVRVRTRFYLKDGKLPFIQIKGNSLYCGTENLETSDVYDEETKKYYSVYKDKKGVFHDTRVELTLTMTDFKLLKEHYELVDYEEVDGCVFQAEKGLFDEYINHYKEIKMNSKGAKRESAKLFLNNLYGKLASSTDSSFKVAYVKDNGAIGFTDVIENNKKAGFIAIGSAITSYSRNFTIRAAQNNYYGKDKRGFIYADTDSIHCDLQPNEIKGIKVDNNDFCCWKLETQWDKAIFARQKTYIEHITHENMEKVEIEYNLIKCAGMPNRCKELLNYSMVGCSKEEMDKLNEEEKKFVEVKRDLTDFKKGLIVPSKLMARRIDGGVLLKTTTFEMR